MNKKTPERKCVGCNLRAPKNELVRIVRTPGGTVTLDRTGKLSGRGAYLCNDIKCFNKARKARRFETNLEVSVPDEIFDAIAELFGKDS